MTGRLGFDALGTPIEGQQGNRTPRTEFVYPRRPARQSQDVRSADFTWGEANLAWSSWAGVAAANPLWSDLLHAGFPYLPGMARRTPTPPSVPSFVPYRIGRYYQSFDVSGPTLPNELVGRYRTPPVIQPASTVPYRIGRYYQLFDVSTVTPTGDPTVDRARQQAAISPASAVPYRIGRYYQAFDVSVPVVVGDATVDRLRTQAFVVPPNLIPYRIGRYYQAFDVSVPFVPPPDDPIDRARPLAFIAPASSVPYRIGRYYASYVDVANTVTDPTDHAIRRPYALPAPSVANRIQRYYSPQIIDVVGDQPADRAQPRVQVRADPFRYANMVRRYYRYAPDGNIVAAPPGSMTVTLSSGTTTARFQSTANTTTTLSTA